MLLSSLGLNAESLQLKIKRVVFNVPRWPDEFADRDCRDHDLDLLLVLPGWDGATKSLGPQTGPLLHQADGGRRQQRYCGDEGGTSTGFPGELLPINNLSHTF